MKKNRKFKAQTTLLFWVFLISIIMITIILFILDIIYLKCDNWLNILTSVTKDFLTSIIVTVIGGTFVKMIAERYFIVKKNDKLLKKYGVFEVGSGLSTRKDLHNIFGYKVLNIYPVEIRMLYITGNVYLEQFKDELIDCLNHRCIVKILLVSIDDENANYVHRIEEIYGKKVNEYFDQISDVKELLSELLKQYPTQIKLRFYRDEYSYNFRSAKYYDEKKKTMKYISNINVQPFNKTATDCSIGLSGSYFDSDSHEDTKDNIFYLNNNTFDKLWTKYENTEFKLKIYDCK